MLIMMDGHPICKAMTICFTGHSHKGPRAQALNKIKVSTKLHAVNIFLNKSRLCKGASLKFHLLHSVDIRHIVTKSNLTILCHYHDASVYRINYIIRSNKFIKWIIA